MAFRLRRKLASQRAQLAAYEFVDAVMLQWDQFSRSDTEVLDFMYNLWPRDAFLPNRDPALDYLERCKARGNRPDRYILTGKLVPWLSRGYSNWPL